MAKASDRVGKGAPLLTGIYVAGEVIWQIMVDVAKAADWMVMHVGCPV